MYCLKFVTFLEYNHILYIISYYFNVSSNLVTINSIEHLIKTLCPSTLSWMVLPVLPDLPGSDTSEFFSIYSTTIL